MHSERNVYNTQAQPPASSSFESVRSVHCLATLDIKAANWLSHHPEPSGRPIHGEVDGLQHGQRFGLLCHTHKPQKRPYPICTNRSGNVQHTCGGDRVEPTLSVAHTGMLFSGVNCLIFFRLFLPFISKQFKSLPCLQPHSDHNTACWFWQCHSRRVFRGWKYEVS